VPTHGSPKIVLFAGTLHCSLPSHTVLTICSEPAAAQFVFRSRCLILHVFAFDLPYAASITVSVWPSGHEIDRVFCSHAYVVLVLELEPATASVDRPSRYAIGTHSKVVVRYLNVPRHGSPNSLLLAPMEQVVLPSHASCILVYAVSDSHWVLNMALWRQVVVSERPYAAPVMKTE